jgi:hypothetical protein
MLTYQGRTLTIRAWAAELGLYENVGAEALRARLRRGWSVEKTLTTPLRGWEPVDGSQTRQARHMAKKRAAEKALRAKAKPALESAAPTRLDVSPTRRARRRVDEQAVATSKRLKARHETESVAGRARRAEAHLAALRKGTRFEGKP